MKPVTALSRWFERHARALPWRRTRDPYPIWISEVMLQQTQVATVIPYYERFLARFPTLKALADADVSEVLTLWSGLGYYSRARSLHKAAKHLVDEHQGRFPRIRETLLAVPGIGPYTAGAVLSIAYDLPVPLVDGNVQRVFARYFGFADIVESTAAKKFFWEKAGQWVAKAQSPRVLNQALMELGATICTRGTPRCERCPIAAECVALKKGLQEELPRKKERRKPVDLWWGSLILENRGKLWLHKNPPGSWWEDLWDLPRLEAPSREAILPAVRKLAKRLDAEDAWVELDHKRHTVTHHRIHLRPYRLQVPSSRPPVLEKGLEGRWVAREELPRLPLTGLAKKVLMLE